MIKRKIQEKSVDVFLPAKVISGTVLLQTDAGPIKMSGINILEVGTSNGTVTDDKGEFTITVKDENASLKISSIGYVAATIPVAGKTVINITLQQEIQKLNDVVVTALGISRQRKTLTYAAQSLKGSDLTETRNINVEDAIDGKVAGLTISKTNSGPGSSDRIIFRGNRSITGNNQPLIIVDGVRVDNTPKAYADVTLFGTRDNGDGLSNINPDDIESMTVLTGASGAALYGSDASNGAIIITTKKGKAGNTSIQVTSSYTLSDPMILPKVQNIYGQGVGGAFVANSEDSWGPKMTGQSVKDWTGKTQALSPQADNIKDFFQTGADLVNTVALSTGTDKSQTYLSYTNTYSKGIIPNNTYKRNNINLRQTGELYNKLTYDVKANYLVEDVQNRPMTGVANYAVSTVYAMPRSLRLDDIKNYEMTDPETLSLEQNYWAGSQNPRLQNPYWSVYRDLYSRTRYRFIGMASLKYQFTPELSLQARTSIDHYNDLGEESDYSGSYWVSFAGQGNYILNKESTQQFNNDILLSYIKKVTPDWNLNVNAGASLEQFRFENTNSNTQGLLIADYFTLGNGLATVSSNSLARTEKQSVYATAQVGYKDYLFLDLTARNDWNSTLPVDNASYFFPSVGISSILNEMLKLPDAISLLKVRASYAYVGNGTGFNQLKESPTLGPGGNGGFLNVDRVLKDADLKPEQTRSFETGLNLGLFNNRINADVTYYHTNTINQILQIGVPNPSGYAFRIINAGNIRNEGIEATLNAKPVYGQDFKWNINFNFGLNRNRILKLDSLQKMPPLSSPETLGEIVAEEGKAYGGIYTTSFMRNAKGQIIVDANGEPEVQGDQSKYYAGNYNPDWTAGIQNSFQYKNWNFSFSIDMRKGGIIISGTEAELAGNGVSQLTVANRETGFVVPNSVNENGSANTKKISVQDYWTYVGSSNLVGEAFVNSATNIRLREASLGYTFPASMLKSSFIKSASLAIIGRNLFFLKNNAYGFDPEAAIGTGNNQGLEFASTPSTRSVGLSLKVNF